MFGVVDDSFNLDDLLDLDPDSAIHLTAADSLREATIGNSIGIQAKRAAYFNKRVRPTIFEEGDHVLVHNTRHFNKNNHEAKLKLSTPWFGLLVIHKRHHNSYTLKTLAGSTSAGRVHANRLKKFFLDGESPESERMTKEAADNEQAILSTLDQIQDDPDPNPDNLSWLNTLPFAHTTRGAPEDRVAPTAPEGTPSPNRDGDCDVDGQPTRKRTPRQAVLNHAFIKPR